MVIKADSPAGFAEQYIVESIWNGVFPPGAPLVAERELSEMIGVTRTTLREVLQRLSRDGWLTIKHGKPTQVNNFWETSSLNVLATLTKLEQVDMPRLVKQVIKARNQISCIYWVDAIKEDPKAILSRLSEYRKVDNTGDAWSSFEYSLHREVISLSQNPMYLLVQNGFDGVYKQIAPHLFSHAQGQRILKQYYQGLFSAIEKQDLARVEELTEEYNANILKLWKELQSSIVKTMKA